MTDTPWLAPLAGYIASFDGTRLDARTHDYVFSVMLDWAGALFAGRGHPLFERYQAALCGVPGETGPASVLGSAEGHPIGVAAATNAAVSHLWEVDDAHRVSTSHPGITVIPALIALAEAFPQSPPERLRGAVVAGYEAIMRIGSFLGVDHYSVCHTTATAGCFGAAAAAAHFLALDEEHCLWALGHAGTQAAGLWQFLDDGALEAKGFHAATAARNGIAAALAAKAGVPGAGRILEGPRGMLAAWHLQSADRSVLVPQETPIIGDITIKNWPTCGQMHSALDCAVDLLPDLGELPVDAIEKVVVEVPRSCTAIADRRTPASVAEAKFSTAFCIAAILCGRPPDFSGLNDDLVADAAVHRLASRIDVREDPAFSARFPKERPARVGIVRKEKGPLTRERSFRKGDPEAPWSREELIARARVITALGGASDKVDGMVAWCDAFADARLATADIRNLFRETVI